MTKRAFCVGINTYNVPGNNLQGCVNDANNWADLLVEHFDVPRSNIRVRTDADARKIAILSGLKDLLALAQPKDVLVFTNSSHGTYTTDLAPDEADAYDECLCPYDVASELIRDDELRELFQNIPAGVRLTVISDSCFSGTVTRVLMREILPLGILPREWLDRRVRFLSPIARGELGLPNPRTAKANRLAHPQRTMTHLLMSGCSDQEFSYDAKIGGQFHGSFSYYAIQAIREAKYKITYAQLNKAVNAKLAQAGYPQHPQLEGISHWKRRQLFV